ncbi:MAG TPA: sigma-70 family RNA polymerase sigma factor [Phycisphaerales bacterium]
MTTLHAQRSRTCLSAYLDSITALGRITAEEERELSTAWREHQDTISRDKLITANVRLVIAYAKRYAGRGIPLDELVAEGNIGLIEAVDNFNPEVGCRFSTYAAFWIRKSIGECFARASSRPKASRNDRTNLTALGNAHSEFAIRMGRAPDSVELARALNCSVDRVQSLEALRVARSMHQSLSELRSDTLADERQVLPTQVLTSTETLQGKSVLVQELLGLLSENEQKTVSLRFGLDGGSPRSLTTVASILNQPPRRTKATLRLALAKLARHGRARAAAARSANA